MRLKNQNPTSLSYQGIISLKTDKRGRIKKHSGKAEGSVQRNKKAEKGICRRMSGAFKGTIYKQRYGPWLCRFKAVCKP